MFTFGVEVKDRITGFAGVVTGKASYITGCDQFLVQPPCSVSQLKEGKKPDGVWFDDVRLEKVGDTDLSASLAKKQTKPGACEPAPKK